MNSQGREQFKNEQRVLTFLNRLKHPNILELLGSYTYNDTNNFLFPRADKNLETLITQPLPQKDFQSDSDYYITLARLSWAIEKMHDYSSSGLELDFIGCHHDLKPDNIFVVGGQFILADFGLATLKPATETSKSLFKQGSADYLAPECVDEKAGFRALEISRPSDIWSFGCILAQIITYVTRDCEGVIQFREKRKVLRAGYLTEYCFHAGLNQNPGVQVWLDELAIEASEAKVLLLQLVRDMLHIDPACRPLAKEVTTRLRVIAVKATFQSVITLYDTLLVSERDLEVRIEFERCRLWGWAAGLISITGDCDYPKGIYETDAAFDKAIATLHDIKNELRSVIAMTKPNEALYPVFLRLRVLNDELCANLGHAMQSRMRMLLNIRMLDTEDPSRLKETCDLFEESLDHHSLSVLAAIKYASTLAKEYSENPARNLLLNPFSIQKRFSVGTPELSWFFPEAGSGNRIPVLVEHRLIDAHWSGTAGRKLFDRVSKLAELLHSTPSPSRRGLKCLGFFCDNSRLAFSLVFAVPSSSSCSASDLSILTFKDVIDKTADIRLRPVLDARYSLAHELALTILYYHQVGWLHKNISAQAVLFFLPPSTALSAAIAAPYLVGFNHSRPSDPTEYTEGLTALRDYQHPEYQNNPDSRYRHEYDYYSLGIVLTEIGLWKSLASMTRKKDTQKLPPENFRRFLLKEWVPLLGYYMGQRYHDVVMACIEGQFAGDETNGAMVPLEFETRVVQELAICAKPVGSRSLFRHV
jgi:serine/threonine protein kinase